jgi:hypothetical protein
MTGKEISRQTFFSLLTYLYVIVFHSASLLSAAACAITVWILALLSYAILPALSKRMPSAAAPFAATFLAVLIPFACYRLIGLIPITGFAITSVLFPDPTVFLLTVPLLTDQAANKKDYRISSVAGNTAVFTGLILAVSILREILGYGSLAGSRLFPESSAPLPMLRNVSGAAFLLFFLLLSGLFLYRTVTDTRPVLHYADATVPPSKLPVLDRQQALLHFRIALWAIPAPVISLVVLYLLKTFVFPGEIAFDLVYLASSVITVLTAAILSLLFGRSESNPYRFGYTWLLPAQVMIAKLPYILPVPQLENGQGMFAEIYIISACLVLLWFFAVWLILFLHTMKRKLLFGNRPEILSGLPLILLITGLCLMIMSGFASIPAAIFAGGM